METVIVILAIAGLIFGAVSVIEANGRSWAGWGVIALALIHIIGFVNQ